MLRNNTVSDQHEFFPIGNTPAICLTQEIPPRKDADVLLLGCGDVRHILFTTHCQVRHCRLDFTRCDIQPAILGEQSYSLQEMIDKILTARSASRV